MSVEIPEGWAGDTVANLIQKVSGSIARKLKTNEYRSEGRIPIVDQGADFICGYTDDDSALCRSPLPLIVFGDHTRYLKYIDFNFAIGADGTQLIRPIPGIDVKFFYYALCGIDLESEGYSRHFRYLKEKSVLLPPLSEQRRIAEILSSVDDAIAATQAVIDQTRTVKQGVLKRLLTKGIGHTRFKQTEIGEIPEEWEVKTLGEVGRIITGKTPSTKDPSLWGGEIPFVTPSDLNESVYCGAVGRTLTELGRKTGKVIPAGGVLVTCIASIGKMAISERDCLTNQQINAIIPNSQVCSEFLYYAILQRLDVLKNLSGTTAVPIINKSVFSEFPVALPRPPEQSQISGALSGIDCKLVASEAEISQLQALKLALMSDLLTGRTRVGA